MMVDPLLVICTFVGGNLIWWSMKQIVVASVEAVYSAADYRAMT